MKKITFLFLVVLLIVSCENESVTQPEEQTCDNGTYVGNVFLSTQQEVDEFGAMCYTKIEGRLQISERGLDDDIIDLTPLSSLTEVYPGRIRIHANNLTSLNGFQNITKLGGLYVHSCNALIDLSGLENLISIGGAEGYFQELHIEENNSLINLNGLNNLQETNGLVIVSNPSLESLDGLENLASTFTSNYYIGIDIGVFNTHIGVIPQPNLSDFCALQNLFSNGTFNPNLIRIQQNSYNPTVQDIIDGNCSQ
ncbi:MAG: hypothetical protein KDC81_07180 [Flavobacteriaceae bacterium]|nr:hypothetical protein [Flavobacteriaceae bacterium]